MTEYSAVISVTLTTVPVPVPDSAWVGGRFLASFAKWGGAAKWFGPRTVDFFTCCPPRHPPTLIGNAEGQVGWCSVSEANGDGNGNGNGDGTT
jgi:hypothetical protein